MLVFWIWEIQKIKTFLICFQDQKKGIELIIIIYLEY